MFAFPPLRRLLALLLLSVAGIPGQATPLPTKIRVVLDDNYPPYSFRDSGGRAQGILKDLWELWAQRTGVAVDFEPMEWGKARAAMEGGRADVIDTIFETAERRKIYAFSRPYATIDVTIFFHHSISGIRDASSLKGFTIGVKDGDACIDFLKAQGVDSFKRYPSYEAEVKAAVRQEIRLLCIDEPPGHYFFNREGMAEAFRHSPPLYQGQFHWAVAKDRSELRRMVEEGFLRISAEERAAIETRWQGIPLTGGVPPSVARYGGYAIAAVALTVIFLFAWNRTLRRRVDARTAELVSANAALRESETRFRSLTEMSADWYWEQDKDLRFSAMSHSKSWPAEIDIDTLLGRTRRGLPGVVWDEPELTELERITAERKPFRDFEIGRRYKDGEKRCVRMSGEPLFDPLGQFLGYRGVGTDITERKATDAALLRSEELYRTLFEQAADAIIIAGVDGKNVEVNSRACEMFGYTRDEFVGLPIARMVAEHELTNQAEAFHGVLDGRQVRQERQFRRKDGTLFDGEIYAARTGDGPVLGIVRDITERKQAVEALRASEARLRRAELASKSGNWELHLDSKTIIASYGAARLYGMDRAVIDYEVIKAFPLPEYRRLLDSALQQLIEHDVPYDVEFKIKTADTKQTKDIHSIATFDPEKRILFGVIQDITERKEAEKAMNMAAERLKIALEGSQISVWETDLRTGRIWLDPSWAELLGRPPVETHSSAAELLQLVHPDDRQLSTAAAVDVQTGKIDHYAVEHRVRAADGMWKWIMSRGRVVEYDANGRARRISGTNTDVTDYKRAQERIEFLAHQDALTELPNRVLFKDRIEQAIARAARDRNKVAVLFLDLDSFKTINDSLGHAAGDQLLQAIAAELRDCVRETDTVSRHGGDEFLIMLPALPDTDAVMPVVEKLMERFRLPFEIDGAPMDTSVSIGISIYPDDGKDFEVLLKNSDMAMYQAKDAGKNTYRFYDRNMNVEATEHLRMRNGLRSGLDNREFVLHYQPQIDLHTHAVVGAEALIRWNHPNMGMVPPGRFIPVAEDTGLIVPIGDWVLREACRQMVAWRKAGLPEFIVAVNLSAVQFRRSDLESTVVNALEKSGLDPGMLELELTESILIRDTEKTLATVRRLKAIGVRLSIDDFGTGYSSLSYLKRFAVDKLKIDQSFVRDLARDPEDAAIVRAIIQLAISLGLRTVAEGVEDEALVHHLRLHKCDEAQGYHFARPMPAAEFADYVLRQPTPPG